MLYIEIVYNYNSTRSPRYENFKKKTWNCHNTLKQWNGKENNYRSMSLTLRKGKNMIILHYADIIHHSNSGSVFGKGSTTFPKNLGISRPPNLTKHTQINVWIYHATHAHCKCLWYWDQGLCKQMTVAE